MTTHLAIPGSLLERAGLGRQSAQGRHPVEVLARPDQVDTWFQRGFAAAEVVATDRAEQVALLNRVTVDAQAALIAGYRTQIRAAVAILSAADWKAARGEQIEDALKVLGGGS